MIIANLTSNIYSKLIQKGFSNDTLPTFGRCLLTYAKANSTCRNAPLPMKILITNGRGNRFEINKDFMKPNENQTTVLSNMTDEKKNPTFEPLFEPFLFCVYR